MSEGASAGFKNAAAKVKEGENVFKKTYSKFISLIHARDFLAECLATFVLVVRFELARWNFIYLVYFCNL